MVFNLFRIVKDSVTGGLYNCGYYETDAPENVVKEIVATIEADNKLAIKDFSCAVVNILKARGYMCEEYEIKTFGYSS